MYKDKRIQKRKFRQRGMPCLLSGIMCFGSKARSGKFFEAGEGGARRVLGKFKVTGNFKCVGSFDEVYNAQAVEVTLTDGTLIPAYRLTPRNTICQNFGYVVSK